MHYIDLDLCSIDGHCTFKIYRWYDNVSRDRHFVSICISVTDGSVADHVCVYMCMCVCVCVCDLTFLSSLCRNPLLHALPQDGWTAPLLAARYGHHSLVQELCETFGADFLHRTNVRAMQTLSDSEWLSELCMYPITMCGCTHRMTGSQPKCMRWQSVLVVVWELNSFPFVCCSAALTGLHVRPML